MKNAKANPVLAVEGVVSGYGKKRILNGVDAFVDSGDILAVIGHNGAGKSTLLKSIFGMLPLREGRVKIDGIDVGPPTPRNLLRSGVAYAPQGNRVFSEMSVSENLQLGGTTIRGRSELQKEVGRVLNLFPKLKLMTKRSAGVLSGGEKQLLALATTFVTSPRLVLLDEPSLAAC